MDVKRKLGTVLVAGATMASLAVVSISSTAGASSVNWAKVTHLTKTGPTSMSALVKAAKKEGKLNVIALPNNWANYGAIIKDFSKKYGIKINSENPDGSSAQEVSAIVADKGRSSAPDVIDVGTSYALTAQQQGLLSNYKVQTWKEIPAALKDAGGAWYDDYGGFMAIGCNSAAVTCPTSFAQMLAAPASSGYKIGLNNSPLQSNSALAGVQAAALANGGSLDNTKPGVDYFAKLNKNGTFVPTIANSTTVENGTTNIVIWWDYLQATNFNNVLGSWKVVVPSDGVLGEFYSQAISKFGPNPAAARLWEEYLYSVTGQNLWLQGEARPAELAYMEAHGTANKKWVAKLPALPSGATPQYPTTSQIAAAATEVGNDWATELGAG